MFSKIKIPAMYLYVKNRSEMWGNFNIFLFQFAYVKTYVNTQFNLGISVTHVIFRFLVYPYEMASRTASHISRRIHVTGQLCTKRGSDFSLITDLQINGSHHPHFQLFDRLIKLNLSNRRLERK